MNLKGLVLDEMKRVANRKVCGHNNTMVNICLCLGDILDKSIVCRLSENEFPESAPREFEVPHGNYSTITNKNRHVSLTQTQ